MARVRGAGRRTRSRWSATSRASRTGAHSTRSCSWPRPGRRGRGGRRGAKDKLLNAASALDQNASPTTAPPGWRSAANAPDRRSGRLLAPDSPTASSAATRRTPPRSGRSPGASASTAADQVVQGRGHVGSLLAHRGRLGVEVGPHLGHPARYGRRTAERRSASRRARWRGRRRRRERSASPPSICSGAT